MLKLKSLKESASKSDGLRIMIARYPIRGQTIEDREWDEFRVSYIRNMLNGRR